MKLIILDRDGVINQDSDDYIKSVEEWLPIPGSMQAMGKLHQAGYTLVVATNQSGIARGYFDLLTLHAMHAKMDKLLDQYGGEIDAVFFCPHGPDDKCDCRKPKDGMLRDIATRYQTSLTGVYVIGDSYRDIESARSVGAKPILVRTGKGERTLRKHEAELNGVPVYKDLADAVAAILQ